MPIVVVCPNGHSLKVKSSLAGRTGRCPVCKALVKVPNPPSEKLSEDAILNILSTPDPRQDAKKEQKEPVSASVARKAAQPRKKACSRCNREIPVETHICPYCHTYVARPSDFETGADQ
jgi:hypothetical protein